MRRSKFGLSYYKLLTMKMGELVPIGLKMVLPGDTIQHATSALIRTTPLLAPIMTPVHARIHHFFVPLRIIWDEFEDFITGGPDGMDATVFPTITIAGGAPQGSLADYLGVPPKTYNPGNSTVSALPFRAYAACFNEYYRDQDLVQAVGLYTGSGNDTITNQDIQNVAWEKDYFTTCRPWTQKGPEVTLPLGTEAPVLGIGKADATFGSAGASARESDGQTATYANAAVVGDPDGASGSRFFVDSHTVGGSAFPNIRADLSSASAATINELRLAFALQRYEEARARYGSRFTEYLAYLGVRSSDARLQRPEYLGGGKQTVQFSEVLSTSQSYDSSDDPVGPPIGDMKGHGIGALRSNRYRRFFEEHGYVISFMSVKPRTIYADGLERHWNYRTKEDFFQKELQHIGQQEVKYKEVCEQHATPEDPFGYQDRYDELRRSESGIAGEFRSTLNYWHMARQFGSDPELNADFIKCVPPVRCYADQGAAPLMVMASHSMQARRIVAANGTPLAF